MTTSAAAPSGSVMLLLRDSTAQLHSQAEGHAFQRSLVTGAVSREAYARYLQQMLLVHQALESALRAAAQTVPAIGRVVTTEQYQEPYLLEDLRFYAAPSQGINPTPATRALINRIKDDAAKSPASLLGYHYVLEGSNNGNRFIAKAIRGAFRLQGDQGVRYLDPYGDRQREVWSAFKAAMDAERFTDAQTQAMVQSAKAMFEGITAISGEVSAPAA